MKNWFQSSLLENSLQTFTQARSPSFFEWKIGKFNFLNGQLSSRVPGAAAPRYPVCSLTFTFWKIINPAFQSSRREQVPVTMSYTTSLLCSSWFQNFWCILKRVLTQNIGPTGPTGPAGPKTPQSFGVIIQKAHNQNMRHQAHGARGTIWLKVPGGTFQSLVN